jgi:hypothetical protein
VVVAIGGWVVEQAEARVKLVRMEVGLDSSRCGLAMGRCSRRTRKTVGSLLWDVLHGGLAWVRRSDQRRVVSHRDGGSGVFHGSSSRRQLASGDIERSRARAGSARW